MPLIQKARQLALRHWAAQDSERCHLCDKLLCQSSGASAQQKVLQQPLHVIAGQAVTSRICREVSQAPEPAIAAARCILGDLVPAAQGSHLPGLAGVGGGPRGPQQQLQLQPQRRVVPYRALQGRQQALAPFHALREQLHAPGGGRSAQCLQPFSSSSDSADSSATHPLGMQSIKPKLPYAFSDDDVV